MGFRILLSAYACQPGQGSEAGLGWNWAFALAKAGASVCVLTLPRGKEAIEKALEASPELDLRFVYVEHPPIGTFLRNLRAGHSWNHLPAYFGWQNAAYRVAKELQATAEFDVIHHVSMTSLHIGSQLWRLKPPLVFGPVGGGQTAPYRFWRYFLPDGWLFEFARTLVVRYLYGFILNARSTVKGSRLVIVANRETEAAVLNLGAREVRTMTDIGFSGEQIAAHTRVSIIGNDPLRLLWIAKLNPRKGLLLALEAMSLIDKATDWRLTIIGDGPQGNSVLNWIREFGLESKVKWLGRISWTDVQEMYDRADLLLFTSLRDTTGMQLLEAMGHGLPVLTLDHQGAGVVVTDGAGIKIPISTPRETAEQIARAIESIAADRPRLKRMGEAALDVARENTWGQKASKALAIYADLLAE